MRLRRDLLYSIEAGVIGLFLIQSIRFLYGTLYAHISSADLARRIADATRLTNELGYVDPETIEREIFAVGIALLVPLLAIFLARTTWSIPLAVALCVVGRAMALQTPDSAGLAAALVVGSALLYMVLIIIRRPNHFPVMLLIGFTLDQLVRASGKTLDPTWSANSMVDFFGFRLEMDEFFIGIAVVVLILTGYTTLVALEVSRLTASPEKRGLLTGWGSLALGGYLFIELTLLSLPNAVARWAEVEYAETVPWLLLATMVPLIPTVRDQARVFLGAFDGIWRGWLWALLLGLLLILGNRFEGIVALLVLVLAQFVTGLTLWWVIKTRDADNNLPNPTPILVLMSALILLGLSIGDYFTYDYAFVRDIEQPFTLLGDLLRSFKGMGLLLFLVSSFVLCMPIILERRVIPWRGGRRVETYVTVILVAVISLGSIQLSIPPVVIRPLNINCLRVASLNLHSGYTLLFEPNLERAAEAIRRSGADIVLLQEVDAGRMSSFGTDQTEWLARELQMDASFFPLNEFLQGLAILSRVPINKVNGEKLTSTGAQAGVMSVELALDEAPFYIYNVWLGLQTLDENGVPIPLDQQDQTQQNSELEQLIARTHAPNFDDRIILGGTFNFDRDTNQTLYDFWQRDTTFIDPFFNRPIEQVKTIFLVDGTSARFDYLWLMNLTANGVGIDLDYIVSDHRLIVVEVSRTPDQQCP